MGPSWPHPHLSLVCVRWASRPSAGCRARSGGHAAGLPTARAQGGDKPRFFLCSLSLSVLSLASFFPNPTAIDSTPKSSSSALAPALPRPSQHSKSLRHPFCSSPWPPIVVFCLSLEDRCRFSVEAETSSLLFPFRFLHSRFLAAAFSVQVPIAVRRRPSSGPEIVEQPVEGGPEVVIVESDSAPAPPYPNPTYVFKFFLLSQSVEL